MTRPPISSEDPSESRWDAVVIGAGPAGSMAARELAIAGARVLLVEKHDFPREKVCGGCLNGYALAVLRSAGLGVLPEHAGGVPLQSFRLGVRGRAIALHLPGGMVVSRARFDAELVGAAVEGGVRFLPRTEARVAASAGTMRLVHLRQGSADRTVEASLVLIATGLGRSCLPDSSVPRTRVIRGSRVGTGCILADGPSEYDAATIHMAIARAGYVGLVRLADGRLHVAGAFRPEAMRETGGPAVATAATLTEAGFAAVPGLDAARWQGRTGLTRDTHPLADTRLFILGDAAGYVEPFTGDGIAWALASGRAIAPLALRAIKGWEPRMAHEWHILHEQVVRHRQIICRAAAEVLRRPLLVRMAFEAIARLPGLAEQIVDSLNAPPPFLEAS
jgi:menaquinone-9 beta-reductase